MSLLRSLSVAYAYSSEDSSPQVRCLHFLTILLQGVEQSEWVRFDIDGFSIDASRSLLSRDNQKSDSTCPSGANLSFRGQTSDNIECPDCILKGEPGGDFAGQDVATVKASAKATLSETLSSTN